uniref:Glutamate decarboxylase 1b n=1 Tax=Hucho hucho TaxID=62062 RepID=A0A4W5KD00_9TELE
MATSEPTATGGDQDPNSANLRPSSTNYDAWMQGCTRKLGLKICGFLQKNNSLGEEGRLAGSLSERQKNLYSCDNSDRDARFRRTETDFSNMFARDLLPAKNGEEATMQFLLELVGILTNYVRKTFDRSTKVLDFHHPHQLLEGMEGFNLELSDQPESLEQILVDCRDTLKYGVRTGIYNRLLNWPQQSYVKQATALNQPFPFHAFRTVFVCINYVSNLCISYISNCEISSLVLPLSSLNECEIKTSNSLTKPAD